MYPYDEISASHGTAHAALDHIYSTPDLMMGFFKFMDANFTMDATCDYAKNLSPDTIVLLRPWMCPWSVHSGKSGWVEAEQQRNLTLLVFTQSFQTNSDIPGVTKPVVTTRNPLLFQ